MDLKICILKKWTPPFLAKRGVVGKSQMYIHYSKPKTSVKFFS